MLRIDVYYTIGPLKRTLGEWVDWKSLEVWIFFRTKSVSTHQRPALLSFLHKGRVTSHIFNETHHTTFCFETTQYNTLYTTHVLYRPGWAKRESDWERHRQLFLFFLMTLEPRAEWYTSLSALHTSTFRNRFTFLRRSHRTPSISASGTPYFYA